MATTKPKRGRKTLYSKSLADKICDLIREGKSERQISRMKGMPSYVTIGRWKDEHPDFCLQSARARADSADMFNERRMKKSEELYKIAKLHLSQMLDIPKGVVEAIKVSIQEDAREAGLRDDSRFGDRKKVVVTGSNDEPVKIEAVHKYDLEKLTVDELNKLEELLSDRSKTASNSGGDTPLEGS